MSAIVSKDVSMGQRDSAWGKIARKFHYFDKQYNAIIIYLPHYILHMIKEAQNVPNAVSARYP